MPKSIPVDDQTEIAKVGTLIPAYVAAIDIADFRCFRKKQTLSLIGHNGLPSRWTVILGENGTGKTTLLETIAALYPRTRARRESEDEADSTQEKEIRLSVDSALSGIYRRLSNNFFADLGDAASSGVQMNMSIHLGEINKRSKRKMTSTLASFPGRLDKNFELRDDFFKSRLEAPGFVSASIASSDADSLLGQTFSVSGSRRRIANSYFPIVAGYGAHRVGQSQDAAKLADGTSADPAASLFSADARLRNAEEWLLQIDYASRMDSPVKEANLHRLPLIREALLKILPDVQKVDIEAPSKENQRPHVVFYTRFGPLSLRQLSLGYQTVISWLVDLASRMMDHYPTYDNFLEQPALVLVDEIDLHLHPKWQRQIMHLLSDIFPKAQFVVTSHSPLVVQAIEGVNTAVLTLDEDNAIINNDLPSVQGWRVDQILTSDLFGLGSARSLSIEELLSRQREILTKPILTRQDRLALRELDERLEPLKSGEAGDVSEALEIIRGAATRLKNSNRRSTQNK